MKIKTYQVLIVLIVFSTLFKLVLTNILGLPNLISFFRDLLILLFFIYAVRNKSVVFNSNFLLFGFFIVIFAVVYFFVSLLQKKPIEGLYFLRIYLSPFIFFVSSVGILRSFSGDQLTHFIRFLILLNWYVVFVALALYGYTIFVNDAFFVNLLGAEIVDGKRHISHAWTISGANFLRLGLPMAGPNIIAIYFACNFLLLFIMHVENKSFLKKIHSKYLHLLFFNGLGLLFTFSRSGMLMLLVCFFLLFVFNSRKFFKKLIIFCVIAVPAVIVFGALTDYFSEGKLSRWISLTMSFNDPSLKGHSTSLNQPLENFEEYYLWGYERATVGPRASLFTDSFINVESSFFIILYDMGVILAIVFFVAYYFLFKWNSKNIYQFGILGGLIVNLQFLPNIIEVEVIMYFILIFLVLGKTELYFNKAKSLDLTHAKN